VEKRRWGMTPAEWTEARMRLEELLAEAATARSTVTYGEAARRAFGGRFSARSGALMDLLGDVDIEWAATRGIMIATLVVRADTGGPVEWRHAIVRWSVPGAFALVPLPLLPGLVSFAIQITSLVFLFTKPLRQCVWDQVGKTLVVKSR